MPDETNLAPEEEGDMTALAQMVQEQVAKALGGVAPLSFEDALAQVDPRDSDAALAMYEWLHKNGRLHVIGQLHGAGYLETYQEPKGASRAGYMPGSTTGGRMVDAAVEKARESGAVPVKKGLCRHCLSAVRQAEDGSIMLDDETVETGLTCVGSDDGLHSMA